MIAIFWDRANRREVRSSVLWPRYPGKHTGELWYRVEDGLDRYCAEADLVFLRLEEE